MLLPDLLKTAAERFPFKPAAIFPATGTALGFESLDTKSDQLAAWLIHRGIGAGDRVAILHERSADALIHFWGILKSAAVSVSLPIQAPTQTIQAILDDCHAQGLMLDAAQAQRAPALRWPRIVIGAGELDSVLRQEPAQAARALIAGDLRRRHREPGTADELAVIIYTPGPTGAPEALHHSHHSLISKLHADPLTPLPTDLLPPHFIDARLLKAL